ncbi:MAG TPA: malonyl-CoA decarboxylase family protein [Candidatus Limnocylindrales bacterium]|nr:malonyl-CoA decarboxylase family protein [Candidatus Limnocylindrales bacterium]
MPEFLNNLLQRLRGERGNNMQLLCRELLSHRGEASQTVLAQHIIEQYRQMGSEQQLKFFQLLANDFGTDKQVIQKAIENYGRGATPVNEAALAAATEPPRQELFRRINTGPSGTETLVRMRRDLQRLLPGHSDLTAVDSDLKHLFRSWFNRGFLRMERINWQTPAITLEKLIDYESVHEINGWPDLHRRLAADRRCFAFFHPSLPGEPVIFIEVALTKGLARAIDPLLDVNAPVLAADEADTAIFYSINNCLEGLRGIPFGNFLIKQVVDELRAELPRGRVYSTLSPLPGFAKAVNASDNPDGFTRERLGRLLKEFAGELATEAALSDPADAIFELLKDPFSHQKVLTAPLRRMAVAYLTQMKRNGRPVDPVANFHFSNGARLEAVDPFANARGYGIRESFGMMVNYRYVPDDLADNHERFIETGDTPVSASLLTERRVSGELWHGPRKKQAGEKAAG